MKTNQKGLIGPLGEDFPSLIPIIFAFLLFFMIFAIAYNAYEQNNQSFDKKIRALNVSKALKENSYIITDMFEKQCLKAKNIPGNFIAGLVEYNIDSETGEILQTQKTINPYEESIYDSFFKTASGNQFICSSSQDIDFLQADKTFLPRKYNAVVYEFPIVLENDNINEPDIKLMRLIIIVW